MKSRASTWLAWRHRLEYFFFRMIICLLQIQSPRRNVRVAESLAWFVFYVLPKKLTRYHSAKQNIRTAFGNKYSNSEVDELILGMWRHLFRMVAEIAQISRKLTINNFRQILSFRTRSGAVRALCSKRPVILLSGHFGNWEMSISVFGHFGFPMSVVARPLDNPYLDEWFERFRRHTGHSMIAKRGAFAKMAGVLEQGGSIAVLCDQDAGARGTFVDFFGHPASTFPTIARLAIEYDANIVVGYSCRQPDDFQNRHWVHYELGCEEVVDPRDFHGDGRVHEITQQFTNALESAVRRSPEQYFWVHRRWKTTPEEAQRQLQRHRRKAG